MLLLMWVGLVARGQERVDEHQLVVGERHWCWRWALGYVLFVVAVDEFAEVVAEEGEQDGVAAQVARPVWEELFQVQEGCCSQGGLEGAAWAV